MEAAKLGTLSPSMNPNVTAGKTALGPSLLNLARAIGVTRALHKQCRKGVLWDSQRKFDRRLTRLYPEWTTRYKGEAGRGSQRLPTFRELCESFRATRREGNTSLDVLSSVGVGSDLLRRTILCYLIKKASQMEREQGPSAYRQAQKASDHKPTPACFSTPCSRTLCARVDPDGQKCSSCLVKWIESPEWVAVKDVEVPVFPRTTGGEDPLLAATITNANRNLISQEELLDLIDLADDAERPHLLRAFNDRLFSDAFCRTPEEYDAPSSFAALLALRIKTKHRAEVDFKGLKTKVARKIATMRLSDPLRPSAWKTMCERVAASRKQIAMTFRALQETDDPDRHSAIDAMLTVEIAEAQKRIDTAFVGFVKRLLRVNKTSVTSFNKADADVALQGAIGSIGKRGDHVFRYQGLELNMDLPGGAEAAFSIYLGRKGFTNPDPRDVEKETFAAVERLTSECPPAPDHLVSLTRKFAERFFVRPKNWSPRAPNSGKGCLEAIRKNGGKRAVAYGKGPDPFYEGRVQPLTILSAGKLRTITLSSVVSEKYSCMNGLMFEAIRGLPWLVSGRSVADWARDVVVHEGDIATCGDGKACTDFFNPVFADTVIDVLAERFFPEDPQAASTMKSFTTHADLGREWLDVGVRAWESYGKQTRGQLMGSDLSFPVLCWVSFLAHLEAEGLAETLDKMPIDDFEAFVRTYNRCGVNGDDIVSFGSEGSDLRWEAAFAKVGGVPSSAKSPCDPEFFTINSQLWRKSTMEPVKSILPAMLLGLSGKAACAPDEAWFDALESDYVKNAKGLDLDLMLLPDVPVCMGGLNVQAPGSFFVERCLWAWHSKPKLDPICVDSEGFLEAERGNFSIQLTEDQTPPKELVSKTGFIRKEDYARIMFERFGDPVGLKYARSKVKVPSAGEVRRRVRKCRSDSQPGLYSALESAFTRIHCYERLGWRYVQEALVPPSVEVMSSDFAPIGTIVAQEARASKVILRRNIRFGTALTNPWI
jgi:hypothetical protein